MGLTARLWSWLASNIAPFICSELQAGAHCGICGKWVPHVIAPKWWAITICAKCNRDEHK